MAIQKQALAGTVVELATALSLTDGASYTVQNTGSGTFWFGGYDAVPTAAVLKADAFFIKAGDKGGFTIDTASPVYAVASDFNPTQITVNEA